MPHVVDANRTVTPNTSIDAREKKRLPFDTITAQWSDRNRGNCFHRCVKRHWSVNDNNCHNFTRTLIRTIFRSPNACCKTAHPDWNYFTIWVIRVGRSPWKPFRCDNKREQSEQKITIETNRISFSRHEMCIPRGGTLESTRYPSMYFMYRFPHRQTSLHSALSRGIKQLIRSSRGRPAE